MNTNAFLILCIIMIGCSESEEKIRVVVQNVRITEESGKTITNETSVEGAIIGGALAGAVGAVIGAAIDNGSVEIQKFSEVTGCACIVEREDGSRISFIFTKDMLVANLTKCTLQRKGDVIWITKIIRPYWPTDGKHYFAGAEGIVLPKE